MKFDWIIEINKIWETYVATELILSVRKIMIW